ncbi:hypothetical protein [Aeromonas phage phiWae14]|nr:hypothetical protein [Aeromonas phage phiWae14]
MIIKASIIAALSLISSGFVAAQAIRTDLETVMQRMEKNIFVYDEYPKLCELHNSVSLRTLYFMSNPFRDYTEFDRVTTFCEGLK